MGVLGMGDIGQVQQALIFELTERRRWRFEQSLLA